MRNEDEPPEVAEATSSDNSRSKKCNLASLKDIRRKNHRSDETPGKIYVKKVEKLKVYIFQIGFLYSFIIVASYGNR